VLLRRAGGPGRLPFGASRRAAIGRSPTRRASSHPLPCGGCRAKRQSRPAERWEESRQTAGRQERCATNSACRGLRYGGVPGVTDGRDFGVKCTTASVPRGGLLQASGPVRGLGLRRAPGKPIGSRRRGSRRPATAGRPSISSAQTHTRRERGPHARTQAAFSGAHAHPMTASISVSIRAAASETRSRTWRSSTASSTLRTTFSHSA
jgi:hypothetical protein